MDFAAGPRTRFSPLLSVFRVGEVRAPKEEEVYTWRDARGRALRHTTMLRGRQYDGYRLGIHSDCACVSKRVRGTSEPLRPDPLLQTICPTLARRHVTVRVWCSPSITVPRQFPPFLSPGILSRSSGHNFPMSNRHPNVGFRNQVSNFITHSSATIPPL